MNREQYGARVDEIPSDAFAPPSLNISADGKLESGKYRFE